ncbi:Bug family tripartite tricarboxylate transporter substrate binding protein [Sabulicella glaciei]|uniref:Tripartite tricarboxylate transporter substrate-binding protein n=1 Tax=Sabulicella glaciei TaxID=2984948 RepID=A0ABT3NU79_9PROT|nr:tripartite tricarboxylate transporter substrate-binding protein [Roseococcus sp. MDT2-1-1]MCW8085715.1 tripartite tricarboxylate transporter substrate-binding protein [Roseococcus sp. MDT2-1-1]
MHRRTLFALSAALPVAAQAQPAFPTRPVRMIVPYAPGGGSDVVGRSVAEAMAPALGGTVVVENRAGAGGTIGADLVAKSSPDGHTILLVDWPHAISATAFPSLPYRALEDFEAVALLGRAPVMLFVRGDGPHRDMAGLLGTARSRPGQVVFATAGNGTGTHLAAELLQIAGRVQLNIVPYRGTGPAVTDLLAGHADALFTNTAGTAAHLRTGALRALCVLSEQRVPEFPDVPTTAELGLPHLRGAHWFGLLAPARTPAPAVAALHRAAVAALGTGPVATRLQAAGVTPSPLDPAAFQAMLADEIQRWGEVVRAAGVRVS